jgi:hypothetical protein
MDAVLTSLNLGRTNSSRITNSEKWKKKGSSLARKQLLLPSFLLALLGKAQTNTPEVVVPMVGKP